MKELENITEYSRFKTIIMELHLEGMHQGIEKVVKEFSKKYYYPNYVKEISKIINACELCNLCKSDHIAHKLPFKLTPPIYETREKFVVDFWQWNRENYLTCIDLYSKFAVAEKVSNLNWLETKRALLKVFNVMGPPKFLKIDQDQGMNNVNIKQWYQQLNIVLEVTTGKTGIGDIERLHKTLNEKLRIINTSGDRELSYMSVEQAIFAYNHTINHSSTGEKPYNMFYNKAQPLLDMQTKKMTRITNANLKRIDNPINIKYINAENKRKRLNKIDNPFKRAEVLKKENDGEHFVVKFRDRNVRKYKSHFKRNRVTNIDDCRNQVEAASPEESSGTSHSS